MFFKKIIKIFIKNKKSVDFSRKIIRRLNLSDQAQMDNFKSIRENLDHIKKHLDKTNEIKDNFENSTCLDSKDFLLILDKIDMIESSIVDIDLLKRNIRLLRNHILDLSKLIPVSKIGDLYDPIFSNIVHTVKNHIKSAGIVTNIIEQGYIDSKKNIIRNSTVSVTGVPSLQRSNDE